MAASWSLLFQPSGEIVSCHYNRGYILGKYPENTIMEAWSSKKRQLLVKSIRKNKYDLGCSACKTDLKKGLDQFVGKNKYEYITGATQERPLSMEFQLDNICNLECMMCSGEYSSGIRKNREKGDVYISPYDDKFVEQLAAFIPYSRYLSFTGGEPFLFDIYYKIWDNIIKLNPECNIYISSNGTILNNKVREYMKQLNFNLTISIDSLNKNRYETIRKNAILETTLENIDYFIEYSKQKKTNINVKCLVIPQNFKDIPELFTYFSEKDVSVYPKIVMMPYFASFESLAKKDLFSIIELFNKQKISHYDKIQTGNFIRFRELIKQIEYLFYSRENNPLTVEMTLETIKNRFEQMFYRQVGRIDKSMRKKDTYYKEIFETLYNSIDDEIILKTAIVNFSKVPIELFINELNRTEINKLIARFRQASVIEFSPKNNPE